MQEILNRLLSKKIILFGTSTETLDFYMEYKSKLQIISCATYYSERVKNQEFIEYGLKTEQFDVNLFTDDYYIVVCDKGIFSSATRMLVYSGLHEYANFVSKDIARACLMNKKIAVFMGPSLIKQMVDGVELLPDYVERYYTIYYSDDVIMKPYANRMDEYKHTVCKCDLYVTPVCEKNMMDAKIVDDSRLLIGCKHIRVSANVCNLYYPQIDVDRDNISGYLYREKYRANMLYDTLALAREDKIITGLVEEHNDLGVIAKKLKEISFDDASIQNYIDEAFLSIRDSDSKADIPIGNFIEDNYRKEILFRNLDEGSATLVFYIIARLCELIDINADNMDFQRLKLLIEDNSGTELIVYPDIERYLGLDIKNKEYKVVSYNEIQYLNRESYYNYWIYRQILAKRMNDLLGISMVE